MNDNEIQSALQGAGLRLSGLRRELLVMLHAPNRVYKQRDIIEAMAEKGVSKSTMIGVLYELTTAGVLRKFTVGKMNYYDGWQVPHHTIVCRACEKFEQVPLSKVTNIHTELEQHSSMSMSKQGGFFSGVCHSCATLAFGSQEDR